MAEGFSICVVFVILALEFSFANWLNWSERLRNFEKLLSCWCLHSSQPLFWLKLQSFKDRIGSSSRLPLISNVLGLQAMWSEGLGQSLLSKFQAPYSSSQYCFMPPALPLQTMPPAYYPRDQSPYPIDAMHYKSVVNPDWGYKKSEQFADSISAYPNYSSYSNLNFAHVQYPINNSTASGMNQLNSNFRQRKKQSGSNVSPRAMGSSSSVGSGKLLNQRTKQSDNLPTTLRTGHRMGQELIPASLHLDNGPTAPVFADSTPKR